MSSFISLMQSVISKYSDFEEDRTRQEIQFDGDAIELDLPHEQPRNVNDWRILSLTYPKVLFATIIILHSVRMRSRVKHFGSVYV